ncbi:MAG: hypothetical protein ACPL7B_07590 [Candidatus Poribacteria bacterium]
MPNLTTAISLTNTGNGSPLKLSIGSELRLFDDLLVIRTGFGSWNIQKHNSSDETWKQKKFKGTFSFGIGLNLPLYNALTKIDYAYTLDSLYADHQMSISFKF